MTTTFIDQEVVWLSCPMCEKRLSLDPEKQLFDCDACGHSWINPQKDDRYW